MTSQDSDSSSPATPGTGRGAAASDKKQSDKKQKILDEAKKTGEKLKSEASDVYGSVRGREEVHQAADRLRDLSRQVQGSGANSLVSRLGHYTRERPVLVLGGAFITGILLARLLRASAGRKEKGGAYPPPTFDRERYAASPTSTPPPTTGTGFYPGENAIY